MGFLVVLVVLRWFFVQVVCGGLMEFQQGFDLSFVGRVVALAWWVDGDDFDVFRW